LTDADRSHERFWLFFAPRREAAPRSAGDKISISDPICETKPKISKIASPVWPIRTPDLAGKASTADFTQSIIRRLGA
jgi:hypothetical protein